MVSIIIRIGMQLDCSIACICFTCRYVTRPSPWCAAFTPEQLKLLEYGDDLFYFYRSGYGHEYLNKNLGCGLVKDLYDRFERTVNGKYSQAGIKAVDI